MKILHADMVSNVGTLIILFLTLLTLLVLALINFFYKIWWVPTHIKHVMSSQGIKGPPYRFIHGNTKEIATLRDHAKTRFIDISHDIYPIIQPHFFTWFRLYGKIFIHWYGPQAELVITEPQIIKEIASNRSVSSARPDLGSFHKKMLGDGLVTSKGEKWARQRKLANHVFSAERLKNMIPMMVESVEMLLLRWKKVAGRGEVELHAEFRILTAEVISRTAFGTSYLQGKEVFEMLKEMSKIAGRNYYNPRFLRLGKILKSSDDLKSDELEKRIKDLITQTIKERQKIMAVDADTWGTDYLGHLVKASYDNDKHSQVSEQDIVDECKTFYVSGDATTSVLLSWVVLLLSIHTEWQESAREEVIGLFGKENPHSEGIAKLKTIGMIINETLRLYPPAFAIVRKNEKGAKLGNLTVPANVNLHVPVLALHHDLNIWGEDAHLFKPERFSKGISKATKNNPSVYMPFGFGPRNCVGSNFAISTTKVTLAMILQRYRSSLSPNYVHSPVHVVLLIPKNGVQVTLHAL